MRRTSHKQRMVGMCYLSRKRQQWNIEDFGNERRCFIGDLLQSNDINERSLFMFL